MMRISCKNGVDLFMREEKETYESFRNSLYLYLDSVQMDTKEFTERVSVSGFSLRDTGRLCSDVLHYRSNGRKRKKGVCSL